MNVLARVLDVAGLAVDAVLRIDLESFGRTQGRNGQRAPRIVFVLPVLVAGTFWRWSFRRVDELVNAGGTVARLRSRV